MKSLFEICKPRTDIKQGQIKELDFAADLAQVVRGEARPEYQKADLFFANTHPTKGLKDLLKVVCQRLKGDGGTPVLRLDTQYGGGKTHALIALTHATQGMKDVQNISEFLDNSLILEETVRLAAFDGENADPLNGRPLGEGLRAYTPWGEIAYGLAGVAGYEKVRQSDLERVAPGADTLRELFADQPALILLDELSIYLRKIKGRKEQEQLTPFLTSLFKAVSSAPRACVVFTLAVGKEGKATDAYAQENEFVAEKLEEASKVAGRVATLLNPTTEEETVQVLRRRLFASIDEEAAGEVIDAYQKLWINYQDDLPVGRVNTDRIEEFRQGFPFHPALMALLKDKLSTLSTFQRVRGMLRMLTYAIANLWEEKPSNTYAIHLQHLNPGYIPVRDEINTRLELGRFDPVIDNDVAAIQKGSSLAEDLDHRFYNGLAPYTSSVARTILWHTFAFNDALQGIDEASLRYSILAPNLEIGFINDARQKFILESAYLDDRPTAPLRFLTEVNLYQLIRRQTQQVDLEESRTQLNDRIRDIFSGKTFNLELFPHAPYEVADDIGDGKPRLIVVGYDAVTVASEAIAIPDLVERIFSSSGANEGYRHLKNNLVFLVADAAKKDEMKEKVKYRLALEAMRSPDRLKQLPEHQQAKVNELFHSSEQKIAVLIQQCYRHLFYPSRLRVDGAAVDLAHATIDLPMASNKPGDGQQQVLATLINNNRLIPTGGEPPSPSFVRDQTTLKKGQISTAELRAEFRRDPRLVMLIGDDVFIKMVRQGIEKNLFVYKKGDLLFGHGDPYAEINIDEQAFVYTVGYAKEYGIWPRPPITPTPKTGETSTDNPYEPTGDDTNPPPVIVQPPIPENTNNVFKQEAPLREALTRIWENARKANIKKITLLRLRIFEASDAIKLMGAIARVSTAEVSVALEASYETKNESRFEMEFNGLVADSAPVKDFLQAQFRASEEYSLDTTFEMTYDQGLSLSGNDPEELTEKLARFATGTALVEAYAEGDR